MTEQYFGQSTVFQRLEQGAEARGALIDAYKQAEASRRIVGAFPAEFQADTDNVINLPRNRRRLSGPVALSAVAMTALLAACGGGSDAKANNQPTILPPTRTADIPPTVVPTEVKATPVPVTLEMAKQTLTKVEQLYQTKGAEIESKLVTINGSKGFKTKEGNIRYNDPKWLRDNIETLITFPPGNVDPDTFSNYQARRLNSGAGVIGYLIDAYRTTQMPDFADFARFYLTYMRTPRAIGIGTLGSFEDRSLKPFEDDLNSLEAQFKASK